jgi:hypothetical protein
VVLLGWTLLGGLDALHAGLLQLLKDVGLGYLTLGLTHAERQRGAALL